MKRSLVMFYANTVLASSGAFGATYSVITNNPDAAEPCNTWEAELRGYL